MDEDDENARGPDENTQNSFVNVVDENTVSEALEAYLWDVVNNRNNPNPDVLTAISKLTTEEDLESRNSPASRAFLTFYTYRNGRFVLRNTLLATTNSQNINLQNATAPPESMMEEEEDQQQPQPVNRVVNISNNNTGGDLPILPKYCRFIHQREATFSSMPTRNPFSNEVMSRFMPLVCQNDASLIYGLAVKDESVTVLIEGQPVTVNMVCIYGHDPFLNNCDKNLLFDVDCRILPHITSGTLSSVAKFLIGINQNLTENVIRNRLQTLTNARASINPVLVRHILWALIDIRESSKQTLMEVTDCDFNRPPPNIARHFYVPDLLTQILVQEGRITNNDFKIMADYVETEQSQSMNKQLTCINKNGLASRNASGDETNFEILIEDFLFPTIIRLENGSNLVVAEANVKWENKNLIATKPIRHNDVLVIERTYTVTNYLDPIVQRSSQRGVPAPELLLTRNIQEPLSNFEMNMERIIDESYYNTRLFE